MSVRRCGHTIFTSPKFSADFIFPWFDAAKEHLQNELKVQEFHNFTSQMARLSMK